MLRIILDDSLADPMYNGRCWRAQAVMIDSKAGVLADIIGPTTRFLVFSANQTNLDSLSLGAVFRIQCL